MMRALLLLLSSLAYAACPGTLTNGYSFCRMVTINHALVPSTQTNFPVGFAGTYPWLKTAAHGGHVANANGYDVIFTSDAAGTTLLTWEPETYNAVTGQIEYWVKIPSLSSSSDTLIYLYYGNASISTSQTTATSTWDANYLGVWHLGDGITLSLADSTANGNTLTMGGSVSAMPGVMGGAAGFVGLPLNTNSLQASATGTNVSATPLSLEVWSKFEGPYVNNYSNLIFKKSPTSSVGFELSIAPSSGGSAAANTMFYTNGTFGATQDTITDPINAWTQYAVTYGLSGHSTWADLLRNGVLQGSSLVGAGFPTSSTGNVLYLGNNWTGELDEVRLSNTNRSQDWLTTTYNNQSKPSSFVLIGGEAPYSGASAVLQ